MELDVLVYGEGAPETAGSGLTLALLEGLVGKAGALERARRVGPTGRAGVASCQAAYPEARTFLCPTVEEKRPDLPYDGILTDEPESDWVEDLEQAVVRGGRVMERCRGLIEGLRI